MALKVGPPFSPLVVGRSSVVLVFYSLWLLLGGPCGTWRNRRLQLPRRKGEHQPPSGGIRYVSLVTPQVLHLTASIEYELHIASLSCPKCPSGGKHHTLDTPSDRLKLTLARSYKNLSSLTRIGLGAGAIAWGAIGLYLSDRVEEKLGYTPTEADKEALDRLTPKIHVVERE